MAEQENISQKLKYFMQEIKQWCQPSTQGHMILRQHHMFVLMQVLQYFFCREYVLN